MPASMGGVSNTSLADQEDVVAVSASRPCIEHQRLDATGLNPSIFAKMLFS